MEALIFIILTLFYFIDAMSSTETEKALLDLIAKQPKLRELVIQDARIGKPFIRQLIIPTPGAVVPSSSKSRPSTSQMVVLPPSPMDAQAGEPLPLSEGVVASSSSQELPATSSLPPSPTAFLLGTVLPPNKEAGRIVAPLLDRLVIPLSCVFNLDAISEMVRSRGSSSSCALRLRRLVLSVGTSHLGAECYRQRHRMTEAGVGLDEKTIDAISIWVDHLQLDVSPDPDSAGPDMEESAAESVIGL